MPNLLAHIVLFAWPLVAVVLFRTQPPERALIWTVLGGYLFVPVQPVIDFPMIPAIDKGVVAAVAALIGVLAVRKGWASVDLPVALDPAGPPRRGEPVYSRYARTGGGAQDVAPSAPRAEVAAAGGTSRGRVVLPRLMSRGWVVGLVSLAVLGVVATTLTNGEPVPAGPYFLPGMQLYDSVSVLLELGLTLLPFLLGWACLGTAKGQRAVLVAFALAGMIYAPLMLIEVRLSPQLNMWIYGFFPHSFAQHIRGDGFRPIVFLSHGLWVGIFMAMAILSSLALWRLTPPGRRPFDRLRWLLLALGMLGVLALSKTLGAMMIVLALGAVVLLGGRRLILLVAVGVAALVLLYPMARGVGVVPVEAVATLAESISPDRASSFRFRLANEDLLLDRANEKALFGWGTWGRGFIYDEVGNRVSITDGAWILRMNVFGWVGYLAGFGLLCLPMIRLALRREVGPETAFLSMVLAANLLDLVPNATLEPITWLLAGSLAGTWLGAERVGARRGGARAERPLAGSVAMTPPVVAGRVSRRAT